MQHTIFSTFNYAKDVPDGTQQAHGYLVWRLAFLARLTIILNWRLHCFSRPQELFIQHLAIQWHRFDPVTIYRPLDGPIDPWGSISTTWGTTGLYQLWPSNNSSIQIRAKWNIETSGQIGRVSFRFRKTTETRIAKSAPVFLHFWLEF